MPTRMTLCPQRGAKHNQILGDGRMDDEHRAHRPARIVEHPFGRVRDVGVDRPGGVGDGQVGEDVRGESGDVRWVEIDRFG